MSSIQNFSQQREILLLEKHRKKSQSQRDNNSNQKDHYKGSIIYFNIIILFFFVINFVNPKKLYLHNEEIKIKISGVGLQGVLFYGYANNLPDFIYLNDDDQENYRNGLDTNS